MLFTTNIKSESQNTYIQASIDSQDIFFGREEGGLCVLYQASFSRLSPLYTNESLSTIAAKITDGSVRPVTVVSVDGRGDLSGTMLLNGRSFERIVDASPYTKAYCRLNSIEREFVLDHSISYLETWFNVAATGLTDHGALTGLADDDHPQYHNDARALAWLGTRDTDDLPASATNLYLSPAEQSKLAGIEAGATADQTAIEIEALYDILVPQVNPAEYTAGVLTDLRTWSPEDIANAAMLHTQTDHGGLTGLADDDHPQYHNDARALTWLGTRTSDDLPEGSTNLYYTLAERTKLATVESGATADQGAGEIETLYNSVVPQVSTGEKTAGSLVDIRRFSPKDIADMAVTHGGGGGGGVTTLAALTDTTVSAPIDGDLLLYNSGSWTNYTMSGDATISTGTLTLANSGVTANTYGSASEVPQFTVDAKGRVTSVTNVTITGGVSQLSDLSDVNTSTPTNRNVLVADGVDWESRALGAADIQSGTFTDSLIAASNVTQHQGSIDHGSISGLSDDDHTIYALLAGRAGGQTLIGGTAASNNLTFQTTSNASKGSYIFSELTTNGFVKTSGGTGALSVSTAVNLATEVTGNLAVANLNSGTGASSSTFWRGDGTWASPAGGFANFDVGGDSGVDVTLNSADLLDITGDTAITTTVSKAATTVTLSIDLDDTAVTPGSYGSASQYVDLTIDQQGRITSATEGAINIALSQVGDVTATAAELNVFDLSATALTAGWVYRATGASTAAWGQLNTSEINNDSGFITGNQTITLSGDLSGSGTTSIAATIADEAVTLAKMQHIATDSFLGRDTAGTGDVEVLSVATTKTLLGLTGTNSGDVTLAGTPDYITIAGQVITRNPIDLTTDITGNLPVSNLNSGTGASASTFWRGDGTWASPAGGFANFDVGGDSGVDVTLNSADLLDITGDTAITTTVSKAATTVTLSIDLDDTAVTPGTYGSTSEVGTFTVDQQGRITNASNSTISITASNIIGFNESVQDALSTFFTSSDSTINTSYNDPGNFVDLTVNEALVDHNSLSNLATGDVHTQYTLLAGRPGGQTIIGGTGVGDDLTLQTTSNATKGSYILSELTTNGFVKTGGGTGTLSISTAVNLASEVTGNLAVSNLNSGTGASASTFWRGDGTWASPAGGFANFDVGGDSGVDVTLNSADLLDIVGATGITTTVSKAATTVTLSVDLDDTAVTPSTYGSATQVGTFTVDQQGRLTAAANVSIDHDALTNFVGNEHINHSSVSITAGTGLSGGGDITTSRTINLSHLGIESLVDPNADRILFWDDSAGNTAWLTVGSGLSLATTTLSLDASGDWTGTFDGQEGTYYLSRANHTGTQTLSTISDVTATAAEVNVLDLSATALTAGWVYRATGASTAAWGALNLGQLGDVTTSAPAAGEVLQWGGANWYNDTLTALSVSWNGSGRPLTSANTTVQAAVATVEDAVDAIDTTSTVIVNLLNPDTDLTASTNYTFPFQMPVKFNGKNITGYNVYVNTAGAGANTTAMLYNVTDAVDVASADVTVTAGNTKSGNATINTANDDIDTDDVYRVEIGPASWTTAPKGLYITFTTD